MQLQDNLPKLESIVFHAELGSVAAKVRRMIKLGESLASSLGADVGQVVRAIELMKTDLVSAMVYEFPELQGLMGQYYAVAAGENPIVAAAIAAHYQPAGPDDLCPTELTACIAAIADKIDTLVGFWLINQRPTGSKDPFALRRAALGVVRLIRENDLRLDLHAVISAHSGHYDLPGDISDSLNDFIFERTVSQLRDQGVRYDVLQAVRGGAPETDVNRFVKRIYVTQARLSDDVVSAYKRAANILVKSKAFTKTAQRPDYENADEVLSAALDKVCPKITTLLATDDFDRVFDELAGLGKDMDQYFETVMINVSDPTLRAQRLSLLADFVESVNQVADLSKLEG